MQIWNKPIKKRGDKINYFKIYFNFKSKRIFVLKILAILAFLGLISLPLDLGIQKRTKLSRFAPEISDRIYLALGGFNKSIGKLAQEAFEYGDSLILIGFRYLRSSMIFPDELRIDLSFKNYNVLKRKRDKAVKDGILVRTENDEVKGTLTYKDVSLPVKIRLKGDWTDHLIGDKWSLRIKTKKENAFLGMKEFSLQHPRTRNYINEFVFHQLLKYERLPYLRYKFIPFYLNGKNLGIYALEEHFAKAVVENSGFREGPIIKFSDHFRNETKRMVKIDATGNFHYRTSNNSKIEVFNANRIRNNNSKVSQFLLANNLIEEFLKGRLKTRDVFDIKLTAKYFALNDLLQSGNSNTWYDMRFYFDPISARLIPIGYDAAPPIRSFGRYLSVDKNTLNLFDDFEFLKEYAKNLEMLSSGKYLDNFFLNIDKDFNSSLQILNKTFPHVTFLKSELIKNQKYIRTRLTPSRAIILNSENFNTGKDEIKFKISNTTSFPIEILGISLLEGDFKIDNKKLLNPRKKLQRLNFQEFNFRKIKTSNQNTSISKNEVLITYRIFGSNKKVSESFNLFPKTTSTSIDSDLVGRKPNHEDIDSLIINRDKNQILIKDNLTIKNPLILPFNTKLTVLPGVNIILKDRGLILVQGSLEILGNSEEPVKISSIDSGRGILVLNADKTSIINNAIFDSLNSPKEISLNITGGLNFYNSKVEIKNSKFYNSNSEDALNLVRSPFKIINTKFKNTISDALDADFSDGVIVNSSFNLIGNDGIDISGSKVNLDNIKIYKAGDKAISVGEKSNLIASDIYLQDSYIGIASKDLSKVKVKDLNTNGVTFCLAAYKKKSEYGPGFIEINLPKKDCKSKFLLETGSSISSPSFDFIPNEKNVYQKLYQQEN